MPTDIERSYLLQGYRLHEDRNSEMVAERRARWAIAEIHVPVALEPGCVGWGAPNVRGLPLEHP